MNKKIIIPIITISLLALVSGASIGLVYAFRPADDSVLDITTATTESENDMINVVFTCEQNQSGRRHQFGNAFIYMHKIQFKNASSGEVVYQQQYQWQYKNRFQFGHNYAYQYHIEGLEKGQTYQLQIEYNNGKIFTYQFQVKS